MILNSRYFRRQRGVTVCVYIYIFFYIYIVCVWMQPWSEKKTTLTNTDCRAIVGLKERLQSQQKKGPGRQTKIANLECISVARPTLTAARTQALGRRSYSSKARASWHTTCFFCPHGDSVIFRPWVTPGHSMEYLSTSSRTEKLLQVYSSCFSADATHWMGT